MAKERILHNAVPNEVRRVILREAVNRYRNELLDTDEREILWNRVVHLRRALGI